MKWKSYLPPPGVLIVACSVGLLGILISRTTSQVLLAENPSAPTDTTSPTEILNGDFGTFTSGTEFAERPLFSQDRREVPVPDQEPEAPIAPEKFTEESVPEISSPAVLLIGTMTEGSRKRALLRIEESGREEWVEVNANIFGWTLMEISHDAIRLVHGGREIAIQQF